MHVNRRGGGWFPSIGINRQLRGTATPVNKARSLQLRKILQSVGTIFFFGSSVFYVNSPSATNRSIAVRPRQAESG
jgi:hypothetical protein